MPTFITAVWRPEYFQTVWRELATCLIHAEYIYTCNWSPGVCNVVAEAERDLASKTRWKEREDFRTVSALHLGTSLSPTEDGWGLSNSVLSYGCQNTGQENLNLFWLRLKSPSGAWASHSQLFAVRKRDYAQPTFSLFSLTLERRCLHFRCLPTSTNPMYYISHRQYISPHLGISSFHSIKLL